MLSTIISALERIAYNGDPLKFLLVETTYQPFISLFHQTEMSTFTSKLEGIRQSHYHPSLPLLRFYINSQLCWCPRHRVASWITSRYPGLLKIQVQERNNRRLRTGPRVWTPC